MLYTHLNAIFFLYNTQGDLKRVSNRIKFLFTGRQVDTTQIWQIPYFLKIPFPIKQFQRNCTIQCRINIIIIYAIELNLAITEIKLIFRFHIGSFSFHPQHISKNQRLVNNIISSSSSYVFFLSEFNLDL